MFPAPALLASIAMLLSAATAPLPCEEEVKAMAAKVTSLENLVAADRAAENAAASIGPVNDAEFASLEARLQADQAELDLAWRALLEAQDRCNAALGALPRETEAAVSPAVSFDLRVAYALPLGNVWQASPWNVQEPMTAAWTGAVPLEIAARYRFTPNLSAGAFVGWGPAFVASPGIQGFEATSGSDLRIGLEAVYELIPAGKVNPWVLLGTGWEWATYSNAGATVTMSGWQYLDLQAGLEFRMGHGFALGPYLGVSGGTFTSIAATGFMTGWGGVIPTEARAFHGWFLMGVQGSAGF